MKPRAQDLVSSTKGPQTSRWLGLAALVVAMGLGCSDGAPGEPSPTCGAPIGESCAGVPAEPLCDATVCTEGVACAAVATAADDASLGSAVAGASAGSCIALEPGTYGSIELPAGVSLLGRSAAEVKVAGVVMGAGDGATLRGVGVGAGGILVGSATNVRIEAVAVNGGSTAGVDLAEGASATLVLSEVTGAGQFGVRAVGASVALDRTLVSGAAGPGLWAECPGGCECEAPGTVTIVDSIVRDNQLVGVALVGVDATLDGVEVGGTKPHELSGGGGIVAASCAHLTATGTTVHDNRMYGVLIDGSSAQLGAAGEDGLVVVENNRVGVWVQNQAEDGSQKSKLENVDIHGNFGVGLGTSGTIKGFVIYGTEIRDTAADELIVAGGTKKTVGDGLIWAEGAELAIDGLTLSGNARQSVLIDGPVGAGSSIANVALSGGDEQTGILQQRFEGGEAPAVGTGTPALQQKAELVFEVPAPPAAPVSAK